MQSGVVAIDALGDRMMAERVERYGQIAMQTARGCPHRCRFCYNREFNQGRWRPRPLDAILRELRDLKARGAKEVHFVDDNFFTHRERVQELCERMLREDCVLPWNATCRADDLAGYPPDFLHLLKRAGLQLLFVGCESGSPRMLGHIHKDITVSQIRRLAQQTRHHDLRAMLTFMVGLPTENEADRRATWDLMDELVRIDPRILISQTCIYTPYPGSEMFQESIEAGFQPPDSLQAWARLTFVKCHLPWLSPGEQRMLEDISVITRFIFWHREMRKSYLRRRHLPAYHLLRADARLRWRWRWFHGAWEWAAFRKATGL